MRRLLPQLSYCPSTLLLLLLLLLPLLPLLLKPCCSLSVAYHHALGMK
jgi:hypothetical protein